MDMPSGVVSHAQLQGVTINQHHNKLHAADHITTGADPLSSAFRQEVRAFKSVSQSFTNTVTLANDADLQFPVKAGVRYGLDLHAYITGSAAAGLKFKLAATSAIAGRLFSTMAGGAGYQDTQDVAGGSFPFTYVTIDSAEWYHAFGIVVPTADDTLIVQWAQGAANATPTIVQPNSFGLCYRF